MQIISLTEVCKHDWIQFVEESDECWLFHRPEAQNLADPAFLGFGLMHENKLVGLCILYDRRILGTHILTYHAGPAGLALNKAFQNQKTYDFIKNYLKDLAQQKRCSAIYMTLPSCAPSNINIEFKDSHLEKLNFKNGLPWGNNINPLFSYTTIINLLDPANKIFHGFNKSSKNKCKQAKKLQLTHKLLSGHFHRSEWEYFIENHKSTFEKSKAPTFSNATFEWLKDLIETGLGYLINFYHNDQCVASLLLLSYKKRAFYFASGVKLTYYNHGVPAYIHWIAVQELVNMNFEWYELGQSYPTMKPSKLQSIGQFKNSFGGTKIPFLAGTAVISPLRYSIGLKIPKLAINILKPIWRKLSLD